MYPKKDFKWLLVAKSMKTNGIYLRQLDLRQIRMGHFLVAIQNYDD